MAKALIETYGCTLNRADSDIMAGMLESEGIEVTSSRDADADGFDLVIVNTCTVKTPTERRIIDRIRRLASGRRNIVVTGCMASANPDKILEVAPSASIVTTSNVHRIAEAAEAAGRGLRVDLYAYSRSDRLEHYAPNGSVIARIPISEGCLSSCGFCETKFARGPLNSFSERLILKAIGMSVARGAVELELTSQDVGAYGLDRGTNIAELLGSIRDIEGNFRVRVGMLNPEHLPRYMDGLIEAYGDPRIYRFIHLPVQSGSDRVLGLMGRDYTVDEFNDHVQEFRRRVEGISVETDMIVGYPGETESDFEQSMGLIRSARPSFTNVSRFGARPHARASRLKQMPSLTIKRRSSDMSRLAREVQREDLARLVGSKEDVLVTEKNARSVIGRDDCYRIVAMDRNGCDAGLGSFVRASVTGNTSVCLLGEPDCSVRR